MESESRRAGGFSAGAEPRHARARVLPDRTERESYGWELFFVEGMNKTKGTNGTNGTKGT